MEKLIPALRDLLQAELRATDIKRPTRERPIRQIEHRTEGWLLENLSAARSPAIFISSEGRTEQESTVADASEELLNVKLTILYQATKSDVAAFHDVNGVHSIYRRVKDILRANKTITSDKTIVDGLKLPITTDDFDLMDQRGKLLTFYGLGIDVFLTYIREYRQYTSTYNSDRKPFRSGFK